MCLINNSLENKKAVDVELNNEINSTEKQNTQDAILDEKEITSTEEKKFPRKCVGSKLPKWREGELSVKEFHSLPTEGKEAYLNEISQLSSSILGDSDEYLLRTYYKKPVVNFFSINDKHKSIEL